MEENIPVYDVASQFDAMNFEDCDNARDILLMLLKGFDLQPSTTIAELIVALLYESQERFDVWSEEQEKEEEKEA